MQNNTTPMYHKKNVCTCRQSKYDCWIPLHRVVKEETITILKLIPNRYPRGIYIIEYVLI
eukprot:SAG11_NODE_45_length_20574_cov_8.004054_9_plen_60_part_00